MLVHKIIENNQLTTGNSPYSVPQPGVGVAATLGGATATAPLQVITSGGVGTGLALWQELNRELGFEPHDRALAVELCRTVELCEQLAQRIDDEGAVIAGQRRPKINPLLAEIRQQRAVAARLTAALRIPPRPPDA